MNQAVINEIKNIDVVINENINEKDYLSRGLLSQNILSQLRNLVEDFIVFVNVNLFCRFSVKNFVGFW